MLQTQPGRLSQLEKKMQTANRVDKLNRILAELQQLLTDDEKQLYPVIDHLEDVITDAE